MFRVEPSPNVSVRDSMVAEIRPYNSLLVAATRNLRSTRTTLAVGDAVLAVVVVLVATAVVEGASGLQSTSTVVHGVLGAAALTVVLWWRNAYVVTRTVRWNGDLRMLFSSVVGVSIGMVVVAWLFDLEPMRLWQVLLTTGWLVVLTMLRTIMAHREPVSEPVQVVVAGSTLDALAVRLALRADRRTKYEVAGFVMDRLDENVPDLVAHLALGSIDHLPHVARKTEADLVVVCLGAMSAERFAPMVRELNNSGVDVALSTGLGKVALRRVTLGHVSGRPLVRITPAPLVGWHLRAKRAFDVVGATLLLIVTAPIMAIAWLAIRLEGGGKAIFTQQRVGKGGEQFTIYKLRTMVHDAEAMQIDLTSDQESPVFKMTNDPRVTRVGNVLRVTSIDELPQLVNIIRGEMSLVGPRPLPLHEIEAAPSSFLDRQVVKPGLTGQWQVSGRSDTGFDELDELDRWYVDNWSLGQDLEILARTLPAVLLARGAR